MIPPEVFVCVRTRCLETVKSGQVCVIELSQLISWPTIIFLHDL